MPAPITPAVAAYRLYRLRRLWVVVTVLPVLAAAIAAGISGHLADTPLPEVLGAFALLWAIASGVLVILYPTAGIELLAMAVTLTLVAPFLPMVMAVSAQSAGRGQSIDLVLFCGLLVLMLAVGFVQVVRGLALVLGRGRHLEMHIGGRVSTGLDARSVFEAMALRPNTENQFYRSGPAGENGFFEVTRLPVSGGRERSGGREAPGVSFHARQLDGGVLWQAVLAVSDLEEDGHRPSSVLRLDVIPNGDGAEVVQEEIHDNFLPLTALLVWLVDFYPDYIRARLDAIEGRPSRAICSLPNDSPLAAISRAIRARLADPE